MKRLIALMVLMTLAACERPAESTAPTTNNEYNVERLFTTDGCTVYRFHDNFTRYYFVKCDAGQHGTQWQENCGKNCNRSVEVPTA